MRRSIKVTPCAPRRGGHPGKGKVTGKTLQLKFNITPEDKAELIEAADNAGMLSMTEYLLEPAIKKARESNLKNS